MNTSHLVRVNRGPLSHYLDRLVTQYQLLELDAVLLDREALAFQFDIKHKMLFLFCDYLHWRYLAQHRVDRAYVATMVEEYLFTDDPGFAMQAAEAFEFMNHNIEPIMQQVVDHLNAEHMEVARVTFLDWPKHGNLDLIVEGISSDDVAWATQNMTHAYPDRMSIYRGDSHAVFPKT